MSILHPDMVWSWPRTSQLHDPLDWVLKIGRYNYKRWKEEWQHLFTTHKLVHNRREIKKIVISKECDGAFTVVDIDKLWIDKKHRKSHWKGRTCKIYTKIGNEWKMIMQTGVLEY